ncbi:MFS transporter [Methanosphaera sp.]|uniref:MFS transporter n=1 Tax=Methanosphaera sp. TaxID=2666342 RepID=UPI0025F159EF|nr:MFS transporter [Methanosphaera sp.]
MDEKEITDVTWIPLLLISLAAFIITLDSTFMNVAISQLITDLNTTVSTVQLIISFYTLITASLMLIGSRLQDIIGKKKVFLIGAGIYGIGALLAAISQNALMLFTGWSLLEGIGGSLMTPATISIASQTYKSDKRTFALAMISAMAGIAAAIGPLFGGIVTTFLSWRYGFVLELLIIIVVFIFSGKIQNFEPTLTKKDFDLTGSILLIFGLMSFVLGILLLEEDVIITVSLVILSLVILSLFASYEYGLTKGEKTPLIDINMLKVRNLSVGTLIRLITSLAMGGSLFAISIFLQSVLKYDAFTTGLNLLPATVGILLSSIIAPKLTSKINHKTLMIVGFLISMLAATILSTRFGVNTTFSTIAPGMFLFGLGLGFVLSLGIDISLAGTKEKNQSTASGLLSTGQTLGMSMGTAIIGCMLIVGATWGLHDAVNTYAPNQINDEQFHAESQEYLQKMGQINITELQGNTGIKEQIVNTVLTDAMKFVMSVTSAILAIGLLLTLALNDIKSYQLKRLKK